MGKSVRGTKNSPEKVFTADLPFLRRLLGTSADNLIPLFADAAVKYKTLERETIAPAAMRRTARAHVMVAKNLERPIGKLLSALDSATGLVAEAKRLGYVHDRTSGTIGQLNAPLRLRQRLDALRDAAALVKEWAEEWRQRAEPEARIQLTRGRKIGDRQEFANWIAFRLHCAGLHPTATVGGVLEKMLSIMYRVAGIRVLSDLRRDMTAAVAYVRSVTRTNHKPSRE